MLPERNDYEHFYYNAGLHIARFLGDRPLPFKHRAIGQFKDFIEAYGGIEGFEGSEHAVNQFLRKTKGATRAFSKY